MKNIIIALCCLLFTACSDVLEEHPKALASETFYKTHEDVKYALNAMYDPLEHSYAMGALYPAQQEAYADYGFGRGSYTLVSEYQGLDDTNIGRIGSMWEFFYRAIRNANLVLERVPFSDELTDSEKATAYGEARFIRAMVYMLMVQNWGGVPLRVVENAMEVNVPRSSVAEVWVQIESDLRFAAGNGILPSVPRKWGTPSHWSAKTLLVECLLHQKKYEEAKSIAEEIINSKVYSLIKVLEEDDFANLYGANLVSTTEEIFYIKYAQLVWRGWEFPMFPHHPGGGYINGNGYFALISDSQNKVIANWDDNDLRKSWNWYSWDIGIGPTTILNRKYRDKTAPDLSHIGVDYPLYRYADLLLWYAELDCRVNNRVTPEALEVLNQIHRRGYGYDYEQSSPVDFKLTDFNDATSFLNAVIKERGYETCYEGKRWCDLKRLGIAKEIIKREKGIDVAEKHMLFPIPLSEMNYNKALDPLKDQNPGY